MSFFKAHAPPGPRIGAFAPRPDDHCAARFELKRIAFVLWSADIGGGETLLLSLANWLHPLGTMAEFIVIGGDGPLVDRFAAARLPYEVLNLAQGRAVLRHPRRLAKAVGACGPDGALLTECSFLGGALRVGGYDRPIVAIEQGGILVPPKARFAARATCSSARSDRSLMTPKWPSPTSYCHICAGNPTLTTCSESTMESTLNSTLSAMTDVDLVTPGVQ